MHIYLDKSFLFFLIIVILTGNFNQFISYFLLLIIHEMGHAITGIVEGYKLNKITLYPYGGITILDLPMNIPLKKELLILIMGPIMQIVGYFLLKNFFNYIKVYHYALLFFNLLPIYPLDGGKIVNIICGYFFNYLKCFYITFFISISFIIVLLFYNVINFNLNIMLMLLIMLIKLIKTFKNRYYYYNRFLLERYLNNYSFNRIKRINDIMHFYRDRKHLINFKEECEVLKDYFRN